jgi:hypothetical protein
MAKALVQYFKHFDLALKFSVAGPHTLLNRLRSSLQYVGFDAELLLTPPSPQHGRQRISSPTDLSPHPSVQKIVLSGTVALEGPLIQMPIFVD